MESNRSFCDMWSICPQQNTSSCSGTTLRRKVMFVPAVERLQGYLILGHLICFVFSLFLWGRCSGENLQVFQPSEISPKGLISSPSHLEERMASDLSFSHHLPSTPYPNLGTRSCSAAWAQCPTSPSLSLPSCCLRKPSPCPCAELFKLPKATQTFTWQKIVKWFRSGPGNHSEGRCKEAAAEYLLPATMLPAQLWPAAALCSWLLKSNYKIIFFFYSYWSEEERYCSSDPYVISILENVSASSLLPEEFNILTVRKQP